jgi:hypothetical protein
LTWTTTLSIIEFSAEIPMSTIRLSAAADKESQEQDEGQAQIKELGPVLDPERIT